MSQENLFSTVVFIDSLDRENILHCSKCKVFFLHFWSTVFLNAVIMRYMLKVWILFVLDAESGNDQKVSEAEVKGNNTKYR